jgi:hypothetical protein
VLLFAAESDTVTLHNDHRLAHHIKKLQQLKNYPYLVKRWPICISESSTHLFFANGLTLLRDLERARQFTQWSDQIIGECRVAAARQKA